jgi:zinc protease
MALLAALCLSCMTNKSSGQDLNAEIPTDPALTKGVLPNGLTYYIRPNHVPEQKVELRLVVKAGSILEDDDQQGLAHFMEHMNFNGTKNFPKNDLIGYLENIGLKFGADLNANTGFDRTVYILSIPTDRPDNLEKGFQVLEDWTHNALLTDKDIDEERGVILEESRLRKGAERRAQEQYYSKLLSGSRYTFRMPIGKDSVILNVSHAALRRFYHDWYRPDLMAVMVIGDLDTTTALKMIHEHFDQLTNPPNERPHFYADIPERPQAEALVIKDPEEIKSSLYISYPYRKTPEEKTINDYRERLKELMLLQLIRLRLRDLYQSGQQIANVSMNTVAHGYRSFFISSTFPNSGPDKNINAITYSLAQDAEHGFHPSEIDLVKNNLLNTYEKIYNERDKKNSAGYVNEYIKNFMGEEQIEGAEHEMKLYRALLPTIKNYELTTMLRQWMEDEHIFTFITAPNNSEIAVPDNETLLNLVKAGLHRPTMVMKEKTIATSFLDETPQGGKIVSRSYDAPLDATTYTLSNGIKITVKTTHFKNDEIVLSGVKKEAPAIMEMTTR